MSEFADAYLNSQRQQEAYNEAVSQATGAHNQSAEQYAKKVKEVDEKNQKGDEKVEGWKQAGITFGVIPLEEAIKDSWKNLANKAKTKVQSASKDVINKVAEASKTKFSGFKASTNELADITNNRFSSNTTPHMSETSFNSDDLVKLKPNMNPDTFRGMPSRASGGAEKAMSKAEQRNFVKTTQGKFGKTVGDSEAKLSQLRKTTGVPKLDTPTLAGQTVEPLDPTTFFKSTKGGDAGGELTLKSQSPYSIYKDKNALEGARAFKEVDSKAVQRRALATTARHTGKKEAIDDLTSAKIDKVMKPRVVPQLGDQLQPMRDHIKSQLPDLDNQGNPILKKATPMPQQKADVPTITKDKKSIQNSLGESKPDTTATDGLGISKVEDSVSAPNTKTNIVKAVAGDGDMVGKDVGESVGKMVGKGLAEGTELDAELGGPGDIAGDVVAGAVGLFSVLGGIFGKHKHKSTPPPPPPPKLLNPAVAVGI